MLSNIATCDVFRQDLVFDIANHVDSKDPHFTHFNYDVNEKYLRHICCKQ